MEQQRASIAVVFAIVLIDMLGFGIVMPVLPGLIMDLGHLSVDAAAVWAGWLGAGYAVLQFVFAPVIGNLSDRFGRRPVLLASLLGFGIDYLVMALAPSLWWLVLGRLAAGITGASWSAAYAFIADVSPPEKRAANFGLMGMAFGFGFIFGPALGGLLGTLGPRVPFLAAAMMAFANAAVGWFVLRESLAPENRRRFELARANAFAAFKSLRHQSGAVAWFIAATGFWMLAHVVYPAIWSYVAIAAWNYDSKAIGLALGVVGLSSALVQGLGLRFIAPRLGERLAVTIGVASFALSALLYTLATSTAGIYVAILVGGLQGFISPSISALASKAIDAKSQGELQGATQAIGSIASIVGPPLYALVFARFHGAGALTQLPTMPFLVAAGFSLVTLALFWRGLALTRTAPAP
ncbi:MAG: MFS transporter [Sphingomonadaceae bacterium]